MQVFLKSEKMASPPKNGESCTQDMKAETPQMAEEEAECSTKNDQMDNSEGKCDKDTDPKSVTDNDQNSDTKEEAMEVGAKEGDNPKGAAEGNSIDPYAYLQRDEFTSEIFKIEINNLPWRFGVGQLRKKLQSMQLKPGKIKVVQTSSFAFVNFKCEEDREEAMKKIEGHSWKGKVLKVKKANPAADPLLKKRKMEADAAESEPQTKVRKDDDEPDVPISERLNQAVSPLWRMDYDEQLKTKETEGRQFLKKLCRQIKYHNQDEEMQAHLRAMYKANKGLGCELEPIIPSPVLNHYRNKCELTVGQSPDGVDKVVGFRLGRYKGGSVSVVEADDCVIMPDKMKVCATSLQRFLQTHTDLPGFDPETKSGYWKMGLLRMNTAGDVLMAAVMHPQRLTQEEISREKESLRSYFTAGEGRDTPIKSLYFLPQGDRKGPDEQPKYEHLNGDEHIVEDLLAMKFRISPGAFFQVNTPAAALLYQKIGDWCSVSQNTVLLDVCCGTGTIGLTLAKRVKKVVGIEMCAEAVADARINAKMNDVTNVEYYCNKAESVLPSLIWRYCRDNMVAVVDPPRAGLHPDVVRAIRKCSAVERLVYVSCKPQGAFNNLLDFTRSESRRVRGRPFRLERAVPVDLFPHTAHSELIMLLTREKEDTESTTAEKPAAENMESTAEKPATKSTTEKPATENTEKTDSTAKPNAENIPQEKVESQMESTDTVTQPDSESKADKSADKSPAGTDDSGSPAGS